MLISIDFDGTIVQHRFPEIGEPLEGAMETMRDLIAQGHRLILNTCREDCKRRRYLTEAVDFCKSHGVTFVSVNETSLEDEFRDENYPRRKVYARCYIDDCNLGGFPGWAYVRAVFGLPPLTPHQSSEEVHETASGSDTPEPLDETRSQECEAHPGCLGAI